MSVIYRIGERLYEFEKLEDARFARSLYAQFTGTQSLFEEQMKMAHISFYIVEDFN